MLRLQHAQHAPFRVLLYFDMRLGCSGKHRASRPLLSRDPCLTASMVKLIACRALDG
jgi:hypothetical protein